MHTLDSILARLALALSGAWRDLGARVESVEWSFAAGGRTLLVVMGLLALALAVMCYRRTTEGLTLRMRLLLGSLRFLLVLCLALIAAGTAARIHLLRPTRAGLVVLLDDSPSMRLKDGATTRLAQAEAALAVDGALARRLARAFTLTTLRTSQVLAPANDAALPQDLRDAVVRASGHAAGPWPPAGLLLLSDGVQTTPDRLADAALRTGAPVSTLTAGGHVAPRDSQIRGVLVPPFAYRLDPVVVTAEIRSWGIEGEATLQLLRCDGAAEKELASVKTTLPPEGEAAAVRVEFVPEDAGLHRYALRLAPRPEELTDRNNELHFHLDVCEEQVRVLFVEAQPGWEYRFAKNALEADPAVRFHGLLRLPPDEWFYQGPPQRADGRPAIAAPKSGFAGSPEELGYFDVLIIGDVERKVFEEAGRFDLVDRFVREKGGGLGTIGGLSAYDAGHYADTPLARLLPVRLLGEKKTQLINRFAVAITDQGLMHPVMQLDSDPVRNEAAWAGLPWVEGGNALSQVKPAATTLLVHPTLSTRFGPRPLAAVWECGRGRVYSTALDGTWHWSMARETEADYHRRFWGLLVRWLAGDIRAGRGNRLILETPVCEAGQPLTVALNLRDASGLPVDNAEASLTLQLPGGESMQAPLSADPAAPGRYGLTFEPSAPGPHTLKAACRLADGTEVSPSLTIEVSPSRAEYLAVQPDARAMAELAQRTGGIAATLDAAAGLELPGSERRMQTAVVDLALWQSPGLVLLLLAAAFCEWALRKRRGLA